MIKQASVENSHAVAALALKLWPDHMADGLEDELKPLLASPNAAVFLYLDEVDTAVAFAQCQLRYDYVEGTASSPVAYLEGIFVDEAYRHQGIASQLLRRCEAWARSVACAEFASDCGLGNADSLAFHLKAGFEEANRIICFSKKL